MAKFAKRPQKMKARKGGPIATVGATGRTFNYGVGYERDPRSELFLLAVTNMVSEDTFYESAGDRDTRFEDLVGTVTRLDSAWTAQFIAWLRSGANMRSASIVAAAHYALAGGPNPRRVVDSALQRADEPGEFIAYWRSVKGRTLPGGVQRGVADAVARLFTENAALRYDGNARTYRMGDVIDIVHPTPRDERQAHLFKILLDARHHGDAEPNMELAPRLHLRAMMEALPADKRRKTVRRSTAKWNLGSWEWLSGWLPGGMDAEAWEVAIPTMGYMALLRNLRNFDKADIAKESVGFVANKLADPAEVARSRQFPIRFYSAYANVESDRWKVALSEALDASLANVPALPGRTLVMVDVSGSMHSGFSDRSERQRWETAFLFGQAFANRAEKAELIAYSTDLVERLRVGRNVSILGAIDRARQVPYHGWGDGGRGNLGGLWWNGTDTLGCTGRAFHEYGPFDRVIIVTDEQADPGTDQVPADVPVYTINVAGYRYGHLPSGQGTNRHTFGGLTDALFGAIPLIEAGQGGVWPWEVSA